MKGKKNMETRAKENMRTGAAIPAIDLSRIKWTCKKCGAGLDLQTGFDTDKKKWKCTECGSKNDVSSQKEFYETLNHIIKELVMEG